jgi:hypothetical protein
VRDPRRGEFPEQPSIEVALRLRPSREWRSVSYAEYKIAALDPGLCLQYLQRHARHRYFMGASVFRAFWRQPDQAAVEIDLAPPQLADFV